VCKFKTLLEGSIWVCKFVALSCVMDRNISKRLRFINEIIKLKEEYNKGKV
jgi:hypothetical protein